MYNENRVLIWGLGKIYNMHVNLLKYLELARQIKVVAITSNDDINVREIDGYRVCRKREVQALSIDYIIVMNDTCFQDIVEEIIGLGYKRKQIINYRVLDIPNFDFEEYIELKESDISIISNNCWGGIIYHTLALECLSPFKNLSVGNKEYITILKDLKKYMSCELNFIRFALEPHSKIMYPVMALDGVEIHCNHDTDPDEAKRKWDRRVKKINYNNLFFEMYAESHDSADEFYKLTNSNGKVCFVPFEEKNHEQLQLHMWRGQKEFYETVNINAGIATGSYKYNPIKLLLGKEAVRCVR